MKKNDWSLLVSVSLYSFLFYRQAAGINFLLFTIALIGLQLWQKKELWQNRPWKFAAFGSLLSALCIAWHGNALSATANIISLTLMAGLSLEPESSVIFILTTAIYSYASSLIFMFVDWIERAQKKQEANNRRMVRFAAIALPVIVFMLFFFIYRAANPVF